MIYPTNRQRLEQEIAALVLLIQEGRAFFFQKTGLSLNSPDTYLNHFVCKELFQENKELIRSELAVQLLYIKLFSYYTLISHPNARKVKLARNAFAHDLTDQILKGKVKYNFFLHKVGENFKKWKYIFYDEATGERNTTLDLELNRDINDFLKAWKAMEENE